MSIYLFRDMLHDLEYMRPSRLVDQHFGRGLTRDDLLSPLTLAPYHPRLRHNYYRPWQLQRQDSGSTVHCDKDKFQVNLDVQQFTPEEITVKVSDGYVVVEGKHEEKEDEHGFISRHFLRRYVIPKQYKIDDLKSSLSSDGVLTITAPKTDAIENEEKHVEVTQTGEPHKAIQQTEKTPEEEEKE